MKHKQVYLFFFVFLFFVSCSTSPQKKLKTSSAGATSEVLVIMDKSNWNSICGRVIKDYLGQLQYGLNQDEPIFKLVNLPESSLDHTYKRHRNILWLNLSASNNNSFELKENVWGNPQKVFKFSVKTEDDFLNLFSENKVAILEGFKDSERERINNAFAISAKIEYKKKLDNLFGFNLTFPEGYFWAKEEKNFVWIRKETPKFSQAVVIYTKPYLDTTDLNLESLVSFRDSMVKYIPGTEKNSYMGTEKCIMPQYKIINFKNMYAIELRGFWKQKGGGFMGGPFLSYSFVDDKTNRLICLEAYVQFPNENKRDLLLQIEAILHTFEFTL
jgi:hypothetical protein